MDSLNQYLLPYLFSQVVAIVVVMVAYRSTRTARLLFALMFFGASAVNFSVALNSPESYLDYGKMAIPFYRQFINGWFQQHIQMMVWLIATGQFLIGLGMVLKQAWVKAACLGAILFLLAITPLMVGSAFPFPLLMAWAAWRIWSKDEKRYLWIGIHEGKQKTPASGLFRPLFLTALALLLSILASVSGLFAEGIYRDNEFVRTAWRANDWVTLLLVAPATTIVLWQKKKLLAELAWAGLLGYFIYNYAFYLFGAAFNGLFLAYIAIIATAILALAALIHNLPVHKLQVPVKTDRWIAGYLFFIALMLTAVEVPPAARFLFTGQVPDIVVKTGSATSIVYALDLTLVVPACLAAGYGLLRKQSWGILLSAILLIKGISYGAVLLAATFLEMQNGTSDPLLPFYGFILLGGLAGLTVLLRTLKVVEVYRFDPAADVTAEPYSLHRKVLESN